VRLSPLQDTLGALTVPLDPVRREFVDFTGAAFYSPLPYLPQVTAIVVGRGLGLGPLGLLYAARLVNGLAALLVVAAAVRVLPVGNMALLVLGLLPMALFEFASASPDAAVISAALLFTAIAMRARFRGRWHGVEVLLACIAGAVFCSLRPVYAPLLIMGVPGVLWRGAAGHVIAVHAVIVAAVLGATALWLSYSTSILVLPVEGTNLSRQFAGIMSRPGAFASTVLNTIGINGTGWVREAIGVLGWLRIRLPKSMYVLPIAALVACMLLRCPNAPRIGPTEALWQALLLGASALLVMIALYLYFTPVGLHVIHGVQGRYFLPLAGLAAVTLCAATPLPPWVLNPLVAPAVLLMVTAEVVLTFIVVMREYQVV